MGSARSTEGYSEGCRGADDEGDTACFPSDPRRSPQKDTWKDTWRDHQWRDTWRDHQWRDTSPRVRDARRRSGGVSATPPPSGGELALRRACSDFAV